MQPPRPSGAAATFRQWRNNVSADFDPTAGSIGPKEGFAFLKLVLDLIKFFKDLGQEKKRAATETIKTQTAIKNAVSKAWYATEGYYAHLAAGKLPDKQVEINIAECWDEAGRLIKPYDENLASRLGLKGRYWLDGGTWSAEQVAEAGIQLDRVRAEGMTLFGEEAHRK